MPCVVTTERKETLLPWIKLDHDHPEVLNVPPPLCEICGRAVDETQYHCADSWCPYPYPPVPVDSAPTEEAPVAAGEPEPAEGQSAPASAPAAESAGQPPADVAPVTGVPEPT
jgi:hypothetical protein